MACRGRRRFGTQLAHLGPRCPAPMPVVCRAAAPFRLRLAAVSPGRQTANDTDILVKNVLRRLIDLSLVTDRLIDPSTAFRSPTNYSDVMMMDFATRRPPESFNATATRAHFHAGLAPGSGRQLCAANGASAEPRAGRTLPAVGPKGWLGAGRSASPTRNLGRTGSVCLQRGI